MYQCTEKSVLLQIFPCSIIGKKYFYVELEFYRNAVSDIRGMYEYKFNKRIRLYFLDFPNIYIILLHVLLLHWNNFNSEAAHWLINNSAFHGFNTAYNMKINNVNVYSFGKLTYKYYFMTLSDCVILWRYTN